MTTTIRMCAASFASLLAFSLMSSAASAQAAPQGPSTYPNAPQGQYPQQPPGQQQPYPQQAYPQQYPPQQQPYAQPGYPPQYPPAQQPGYPPQYPPQPPPGQPYPQQGYPQQYPAPGGYPPPPPQGHHGLLLSGYIGIHSFRGQVGEPFDPGLRLGGLLGVYVNPVASLNGELTIDALNIKSSFIGNASGARVALSFSPLFHLPAGNLELVLGPKFGVWATAISGDYGFGGTSNVSANGYLLGLNAGLFARLGRMSIGGLASFEAGYVSRVCDDFSGVQQCGDPIGSEGDADKILSLTGALLF